MKKIISFSVVLILAFSMYGQESGKGVPHILQHSTECLSDTDREHIKSILLERKQVGTAKKKSVSSELLFQLPIRQSSNYDDPNFYGLSNYVDLDPTFPNSVLDYNCGSRTYDTNAGYNHKGVDFFLWPFPWYNMNNNQVEIVAAADGVIIYKQESYDDKSCTFNSNPWNAIYIEHEDGSMAWYGHLKRNSLTAKPEGSAVMAGEFLGIMGSSGNSTGPHLHFEVYDSEGNLVDPFIGQCNSTTERSWWIEQENYYNTQINKLFTLSNPPVFGCHEEEQLNHEVNFLPGQTVYFMTTYRDQLETSISTHQILRPDGSLFQEWNTTSSQYYAGSYWWRSFTIPASEESGKWTFKVEFENKIYEEFFYLVGQDRETIFSLSADTLYVTGILKEGDEISSFSIINSDNRGLVVDSINSSAGLETNWYGLLQEGEEKMIRISNPRQVVFDSSKLIIYTRAGNKEIFIKNNCFDNYSVEKINICEGESYEFGGQSFSTTGNYIGTFPSSTDCDSISILELTVTEINDGITLNDGILAASESDANYQWLDCSNGMDIIENATEQSYLPEKDGSYAVRVIKGDCEITTLCVQASVASGIAMSNPSNLLSVFPVPTSNELNINYNFIGASGKYELIDLYGNVLLSGMISDSGKEVLNIEELRNGLYLLKIMDANKGRMSVKIVKQ